jgi:Family of unknown function (DUF695)
MLGTFKKSKDKSDHSDDDWVIAQGEDNGFPLIIRSRVVMPKGIKQKLHRHSMSIVWEYVSEKINGFPSSNLQSRMEFFENALVAELEGVNQAFLTAIFTCKGRREWHWYSCDPEDTVKLINKALINQEQYPISITSEDDPDWDDFRTINQSLKNEQEN